MSCFELPIAMQRALAQAKKAGERGEVPVGCVITDQKGQILFETGNRIRELHDPTAHAEILSLRAVATMLKRERLNDLDLYVTLEPCAMCAGAISHARIRRLYFAAEDKKMGAIEHGVQFFSSPNCHHRPEIIQGSGEEAARTMLQQFFLLRR